MQNLISLWQALDARKRAIVAGATIAVFLAVLALARVAGTPGMSLLYSGLQGAAAGEVVAALEQDGVVFEVRGESIYVDSSRRDSLRMVLATQGLPANSGTGYELLDGLSGFGTTSQMFDAAYWRAKEGEIARTILANPMIRAARVHIAQAPSKPFQQDQKAKASVTVSTAAGGLPAEQARALRHLVAAAVPGMQPADVAVIDAVAGLLPGEDASLRPDAAGEARAAELRRNVERLLEARVGAGKAVVEVAVEVVTEREAITERTFDPQGRVAISQETENRSGTANEPGGAVTVASNLPDGDAGAGAAGKSETSESRERVNYEVSETQREVLRTPGAIRKISVAVLVDGQSVTAADGTQGIEPRGEDELAVLRELVASAVGLDEARGDVLTIKSLAFRPDPAVGELLEAGILAGMEPVDLMSIIQMVVLALVVLVLGLFVLRPVLTSRSRLQADAAPLQLPGAGFASGLAADRAEVLTGEIAEGPEYAALTLAEESLPGDPVSRLRRLIEERQAETVEILRGWMEQDEERA
ncbi:flagellar basal-body MS-ring/collar protein FliF [Tabrizicola oligotrophica]|uniref:Flagellar M-ring protein n=1 Tax=Tabrizicola oligotrophica TaxID=2710650 RepID=A0A6M0QUP5_9RHOB|nr:flagellar basal-body MS-ring/collar protein FliF [Tabrizicola oligotrophica]NEY91155.1 flagellar M-ring protein FliF [Tabrizicola oligotrophica]